MAKPDAPRRRRLVVAVFAILALIVFFPLSCDSGFQGCRACDSTRTHRGLRWGPEDMQFQVWESETVETSAACADFFPHDHAHEWGTRHYRQVGALVINTFLTGGTFAHGSAWPNPFGWAYLNHEPFREFVRGKVAAGEVRPEEVRRLFALRRRVHQRGVVPAGTHALVRKANAWVIPYEGRPLWDEEDDTHPWPREAPP